MLYHTFLILYRNCIRFKSSFLINLVSLASGLSAALLIYLWVNDELNIDKFHIHDGRLFQVMQNIPGADGIRTTNATPGLLAEALRQEIPDIEEAVIEYPGRGGKGIIRFEEKSFNATEQYVTNNYLYVFSYALLNGNIDQLFTTKQEILISDELALKLFNTTDVVGKTVEWDQGNLVRLKGSYNISGVFRKPQTNSSKQFDLLFSYDLLREEYGSMLGLNRWTGSDPGTYILLKEGARADEVGIKIKEFIRIKIAAVRGQKDLEQTGTLFLQKYSDRYLYNHFENGLPAGGRIAYVRLFSLIASLILGLACINFMNLTTARVTGRLKEIGIKKSLGANQRSLAIQFIQESVLMAFIALPAALLIIQLCLPYFNELTGKLLVIPADPVIILTMAAITFFTGLAAGIYPALYLSRYRPAVVLQPKSGSSEMRGGTSWLRSTLVVFQFSISVILIVFVLVVYSQIDFIHTKELGFEKNNVIHFVSKGRIVDDGPEAFINEVKRIPGVLNVSTYQSQIITKDKRGIINDVDWQGNDRAVITNFNYLRIGNEFIETLGMTVIEGRAFPENPNTIDDEILLNEKAVASMRINDPVGKIINVEGIDKKIIGIIKDFHFESFYEPIKPCLLLPEKTPGDDLMIRIQAGMEDETLKRIESFYRVYNNGLAFEYNFLEDDYRTTYATEQQVASLSRYFAGIAIIISCLGLFGLTAFTAERKVKEIGIRKILGSTVFEIILLLAGKFIGRITIALLIALPLSYFIAEAWLDDFAFRIDLHPGYFGVTAIFTLFISCLTTGILVARVAQASPVDSLKSE